MTDLNGIAEHEVDALMLNGMPLVVLRQTSTNLIQNPEPQQKIIHTMEDAVNVITDAKALHAVQTLLAVGGWAAVQLLVVDDAEDYEIGVYVRAQRL